MSQSSSYLVLFLRPQPYQSACGQSVGANLCPAFCPIVGTCLHTASHLSTDPALLFLIALTSLTQAVAYF